jgi:integrase
MAKARLDERMAELNDGESIPQWQFHDLRRTARSLMARAGISQEIAERTLGHAQSAIVDTYDQNDYQDERGDALHKLAGLLALILEPPADNVELLHEASA